MKTVGSRRETRARHEQARHLRACGHTWQAIADILGYRHRQAAKSAVERLQARDVQTPEMARRSLADGLNLQLQDLHDGRVKAKLRGDDAALLGYSKEIRSVTDQLAKLDGLHAAQKVDVSVTHQTSEILANYRRQLHNVIDAEIIEQRELEQ